MTNIPRLSQHLGEGLFLLSLLAPPLAYAAGHLTEPASMTDSTAREAVTESMAGDLEPPLGASPQLPGQEADAVTTEVTRLKRSAQKLAPDGHLEVPSRSAPAGALSADDHEGPLSSAAASPAVGLDPHMALEVPTLAADGQHAVYGFLRLDEHLSDDIEQALEAMGVTLLGPHGNLYKAKFPVNMEVIESVARLPYVEWVGYSPPDLKQDRDLQRKLEPHALSTPAATLPIVINLFEDDEDGAFGRRLAATGALLGTYDKDLRAYSAAASPAALAAITQLDFVLFVEPVREARAHHDQSMPTIGVDYIRPGGAGLRFDGLSTPLGIMDTGFMMGDAAPVMHVDLNKFGCGRNFTTDTAGVWNDQHGHGTHVLATITGTGTADARFRGVAMGVGEPGSARIRAAKVFRSNARGNTSWTKSAMDFLSDEFHCGQESPRPQVINYSGGTSGTGLRGTDSTSRKLDEKVWRYKQLYVVAAGNDGPAAQTVSAPGVAKNALTVGNVFDFGFPQVGDLNAWTATGSGQGPTGDGRMKPNVVAPGTWVRSASAGTADQYRDMFGTSMATPHVAGLAATLMQHYPEFQWQPYLLRAHLMASALPHDNLTTPGSNHAGGRNDYGLGRVSAYLAHWAHGNPNGWASRWAWGTVNRSKWLQFDIDVPSGTRRLVVVATWDEPAASAGARRAVSYDLDLWIDQHADCAPNAKGECGDWNSQSDVDNVEYIIVNDPPAGIHRLKVIPWNAPTFDLPVGLAATIIHGDPAPAMTLAATPSASEPLVGGTFTVTTSVANPSYVASGVHLALTSPPAGLTMQGVQTTRADGVVMNVSAQELTLGDIIEGDVRSAVWTFRADAAGPTTLEFRAWSENGGIQVASVTVNATSGVAFGGAVPTATVAEPAGIAAAFRKALGLSPAGRD
jgi:Subtilase family